MIYTILAIDLIVALGFVGFFFVKKFARRRASAAPQKAVLEELKLLEADLSHDFLKAARASAEKKLSDKKRKRVEAIYLEHPDLLG